MPTLSDTKKLLQSIRNLILDAQQRTVRNINAAMVLTYFEIGNKIVQQEQEGQYRATYAKKTIERLSKSLTKEFGKGYSISTLENCRKFFITYENRIPQTVFGELATNPKRKAISSALPFDKKIPQTLFGELPLSFSLGWSHYIQLMKISNEDERNFYEIEAIQNNWSVRELQRQYDTALYERLALARNKKSIKNLSIKGQKIQQATDALKSHYVLEFLGLQEKTQYTESDLETAIINKLEQFMLELGKGFLFEGRQRRFTFDGDSFFVDLVFYNRLLRCFVLFDLKIGKLTHQDIGQMQMYVNYYDRMVKTKAENKTIGIILCKEGNRTVIEFTLPENNKTIFATEYKEVLPSKLALKKQLK